jgi:hypothetical protein
MRQAKTRQRGVKSQFDEHTVSSKIEIVVMRWQLIRRLPTIDNFQRLAE